MRFGFREKRQYICIRKGGVPAAPLLSLFFALLFGKKSREFRKIFSDLLKNSSEIIFRRSDFANKSLDIGTRNLKLL